jgi:nucleoside 2-deoxyribosyltransferase
MIKVYLAGPDVFLPDPMGRADAMRRICRANGLCGVSPLDPLPGEVCDPASLADPYAIARRNEAHIRNCDAILANLTPFRGPGADPGTVYEVGFGRALGRPVFGYATAGTDHGARVRALPGSTATRDAAGLAIEDFGLFENLMIACGIEASGGFVLAEELDDRWGDLSVFERCVAAAARTLATMKLEWALPV